MLFSGISLTMILASIPALIIAAAGHEFAHAKVADMLGDSTPRSMGRLTLNPVAHLDLIGSIAFLIGGFGWAKPVMVDTSNFRDPRTDYILVSIAGPASNVLMAFLGYLALRFLGSYGLLTNDSLELVLTLIVVYNINFAILNMMPIPPLDGSRIITSLLPRDLQFTLERLSFVSLIVLILVLNTPIASKIFIPLQQTILQFFERIVSIIL
ncbi:site-2 protease family protein [uncultured Veillonella sp.]|uniref:site-2 protease family protein n=1 Tax=uncultured Veillonella sp. TaxID=159268 RepID=UPI0028EA9C88|nr:site-2 protease family protein [uncultured Veillonella sp.]